MPINLNETWNDEQLSEVRKFVQSELKKSLRNIAVTQNGSDVELELTTGGGDKKTVSFIGGEGSNEGYSASLSLRPSQGIYATGSSVAVLYNMTVKLGGNTVFVVDDLSIEIRLYKISNGTKTLIATKQSSAIGSNSVSFDASELTDDNGNQLEGNFSVEGVYSFTDNNFQSRSNSANPSLAGFSVMSCKLEFVDSGFNLGRQVKGYADTEQKTVEDAIRYVGTSNMEAAIHLYVDGEDTGQTKTTRQSTILNNLLDLSTYKLGAGLHTVQIVAEVNTNTTDDEGNPIYLYSNSLVYDIYGDTAGRHVGIMTSIDNSAILAKGALNMDVEQYMYKNIKYSAYDYTSDKAPVQILKNGEDISNLSIENGITAEYNFRSTANENFILKFQCTTSREINVRVIANSNNISVAPGAIIDISAEGRSNNEGASTLDIIPFTDSIGSNYVGTLNDFQHTVRQESSLFEVDGWIDNGLKFWGASSIDIPYNPFKGFLVQNGMTVEVTFKVETVTDSNAYILKCLDANGRGGFYIKPEEAGIITKSGTSVSTPFASGERYTVAFMVKTFTGGTYKDASGDTVDNSSKTTTLLMLYVNGILSALTSFSNDSFDEDAHINGDGGGAIWHLYGIRSYKMSLDSRYLVNNYITTMTDAASINDAVTRNNILDSTLTYISSETLRRMGKNVMILIAGDGTETAVNPSNGTGAVLSTEAGDVSGEVVTIATKEQILNPSAQKKDNFIVKGILYYHEGSQTNPYSFKAGPSLIQVQGTSSTYYSRKNYDIFFAGQKYSPKKTPVSPSAWVSLFDDIGTSHDNSKHTYQMSAEDLPVTCLCNKADYSDSSSLHNTVLTKLVNDVWVALGDDYKTPPQINKSGGSSDSQFDNPKVRVGINGHPIDMFVRGADGQDEYIGQYNMNNEKKDSHHVFGFEDSNGNPLAYCVECLQNNLPATLFSVTADDASYNWDQAASTQDSDGKWIAEIEFRYPSYDFKDAPQEMKDAVKTLWGWVASTYKAWKASWNEEAQSYSSSDFLDGVADHFNVHNLCAWYLFTEYFLAVDQRSKNMMLATWDKQHWYFLPYDSDTCLGVTNDGYLIIPWDADENTKRNADSYFYMGHGSYLWELVRHYLGGNNDIYNELIAAKGLPTLASVAASLRDESVISGKAFQMSNVKKALAKSRNYWGEAAYNFDQETKYIKPLVGQSATGTSSDFAQFVQGARDAHRNWLLDKRFHLLDAKYGVGYWLVDTETNVEANITTEDTVDFTVVALQDTFVAVVKDGNVVVRKKAPAGESTTVEISGQAFNSNQRPRFTGLSTMKEIDFGSYAKTAYALNAFPSTYSRLQKLTLNGDGNTAEISIAPSLFNNLIGLKELVFKGFEGAAGTLDLSQLSNLEYIDINIPNLEKVTLPLSRIKLQMANFGKMNIDIPWEFWNELNERVYKPKNQNLFVAEMTEDNTLFYLPAYANVNVNLNTCTVGVQGKYLVAVLEGKSLSPYMISGQGQIYLFYGSQNGTTGSTRNTILKNVIFSVLDTAYTYPGAVIHLRQAFSQPNLESVNTKGWRYVFSETQYQGTRTGYALTDMLNGATSLKEIDLSFIDTTGLINYDEGLNGKSWGGCNIEYIKWSDKFFNCILNKTCVLYNTNSQASNYTSFPISPFAFPTLNAQTFADLAEYIPDIKGTDIEGTNYAKIALGNNFSDYNKIPDTIRDKFTRKGWTLVQTP